MFKTREPVIIMTKDELEALIEVAARKAAAEVLKRFQAQAATQRSSIACFPGRAEAPGQIRALPKNPDGDGSASGERIIRLVDVMAAVCLKKSAIYKLIKAGAFPAQVKLGRHASGWRESEIQAWIRARGGKQPANIN